LISNIKKVKKYSIISFFVMIFAFIANLIYFIYVKKLILINIYLFPLIFILNLFALFTIFMLQIKIKKLSEQIEIKYEEDEKIIYENKKELIKIALEIKDQLNEINSKINFENFNIDLDEFHIQFDKISQKNSIDDQNYDYLSCINNIKNNFNFLKKLISSYNEFVIVEKEKAIKSFIPDNICNFCIINEIFQSYAKYIKDDILLKYKEILTNFEKLNENLDNTNKYFIDKIEKYNNMQKAFDEKNNENTNVSVIHYQNTTKLIDNFVSSIDIYFKKFQDFNIIIKNIDEIFSKIKVLSLNLNIEAVKSHNDAFIVISKEFQSLISEIEKFNGEILKDTENSIKSIINEKAEKQKEIESFLQYHEYSNNLKSETDTLNKKINLIFKEMLDFIITNQENNRKEMYNLFKNTQILNINLEMIQDLFNMLDAIFTNSIDKVHNKIGGKLGLCITPDKKKERYKEIFDIIKTKITLKKEDEILNILYKKFTGEEKKIGEHISEDFIIF